MNNELKTKILKSLDEIYKSYKDADKQTKLENVTDIFNLVKVIENYEEFEPEIKKMLDDKAWKEKWER